MEQFKVVKLRVLGLKRLQLIGGRFLTPSEVMAAGQLAASGRFDLNSYANA